MMKKIIFVTLSAALTCAIPMSAGAENQEKKETIVSAFLRTLSTTPISVSVDR